MLSCSCDTMVAMRDVTEDGSIIFAKNSDRQVNEPLTISYIPCRRNLPNGKVRTTYIEIDEVEESYSCVLFRPGNSFGGEMGWNSFGLVIGNEALFTKIRSDCLGLTGMDLVRLVLERCCRSEEGKDLIISLLNKYGQGGNCGFDKEFSYQNSFLLVDENEGWIIETVGKDYAAKRITNGIGTISNEISFGTLQTFDQYSPNLINQAIQNGWCQSIQDFHFQKCYSGFSFNPREFYNGWIKTYFSSSSIRRKRSFDLLTQNSPQININDIFKVLRDHQSSRSLNPHNGLTNVDICMHSSFGPIKFNQTTGSLVSILPLSKEKIPIHYLTSSSLPCLAIFKPVWFHSNSQIPNFILNEQNNFSLTYSSKSLWWKSEVINRNIVKYYSKLIEEIQFERDQLEKRFLLEANRLSFKSSYSDEERNHFTSHAFQKADELISSWFSRSISFSRTIPSELSILQEFTFEQWRKSAQLPSHLLIYHKIESLKKILFITFILLLF